MINSGDQILFIGDSITDAGRDRESGDDLGRGYAHLAAALAGARRPDLGLRFVNRGISGNRVRDLRERWQADCLDLRPDLVSIMIGINDTWRRYDRDDPTSTEDYERDYRVILDRTAEQGSRLILIEPFLAPVNEAQWEWRCDLDPRIQVVRRLAAEYGAALLPADGLFAEATAKADAATWAHDGVHPTPAGHALLAEAWLRSAGLA